MPAKAKNNVKMEYASWLATPKRLKQSLGLPSSKAAFASMKGVNQRTLNRWESQEDFQKYVEQRRVELSHAAPNSTVTAVGPPRPATDPRVSARLEPPPVAKNSDDPVWDEALSPDEQRYAQVKDTLIRAAMDGNQSAMDLYMKHYGRPFIEAEQKMGSQFPNMSDDELISEIFRLVGTERITQHLAHQVSFA
jgi:hypothetical protein